MFNISKDSLIELIQDRLNEVEEALPEKSDDFTLLVEYKKEWEKYQYQVKFLPGNLLKNKKFIKRSKKKFYDNNIFRAVQATSRRN